MSRYIGNVSAYAYAVEKGYTGTEEEFALLMASYATVGQTAVEAAQTATTKASEASQSATTAINKASEATTAAQTATNKAAEAQTSAQTASTKASEATTAATAAQTAKTQTEQSASQALTDIETARTGAISAVQTEGQTQTANARAQAQAAATSATTASTKASEASASATSAGLSATNAATSATSAAQSASAAQSVLESIPEEYSDLSEDVDKLKADLADVDNHTVKSAEQLISDKRTVDKVPYKYRASQSGKSDRAYDCIVGGTVCFNQIVKNMRGNSTEKGLTFVNNNGTITISGTVTEAFDYNTVMLTNNTVNFKRDGSKYLLMLNKGIPFAWGVGGYGNVNPAGNRVGIWTNNSGGVWTNGLTFRVEVGQTVDIHELKASVFDLTAMFGTTIADHIYSLEQATAGAGVALFKAMFADDYYPYNVGSLVSVEGLSAKEAVGFNRFDKSTVLNGYIINDTNGDAIAVSAGKITDYIPVIPKQAYYIKSDQASGAWGAWYDADKNYISGISGYRISDNLSKIQTAPANARYMRLTCFYNNSGDLNTFCVNVSNPARNGEYEPYDKHTYPLDNSLTLRGVPVLKDGKIEFDGDTYEANGTVTRRYAERAYQSGDESLANAITDGTNTVYKLSVETTETAIPYTSPQIVDPYGTEEYVSETICPVGHITEYPDNLRAKIDGLPWDLSMLAPVESTYTATRNYTTGQLLIVGNTLYKVTANIANGGNITPNTNVIATTLTDEKSSIVAAINEAAQSGGGGGGGSSTLSGLTDTSISNKTDGQVLTYDGTSNKWVNRTPSGGSTITVDTAISSTSTNPVQNKVIKQALDNKAGTAVATTSANGLMSATDKSHLDAVYADYSSAIQALGA